MKSRTRQGIHPTLRVYRAQTYGGGNGLEDDGVARPQRGAGLSAVMLRTPLIAHPTVLDLADLGDIESGNDSVLGILPTKYSLQRHFDRHHAFQPGDSCRFPHSECTAVTLDRFMHFHNHAAKVHAYTCNLPYRGNLTFCALHCPLKCLLCYVAIWGRRRARE